jgi:hypothetical protein
VLVGVVWPACLKGDSLPTGGPDGLHLKSGDQKSFNINLTDGGGYRWDFQYTGAVQSGTKNAFSGGVYCRVRAGRYMNNLRARNHRAWVNQASNELEIVDQYIDGRYRDRYRGGLKCYRRIRVFKDRPLARWLDIFENPGDKPVSVQVNYYWNFRSTLRRRQVSEARGERDTRLITGMRNRAQSPSVMHVLADRRGQVKPKVKLSGSTMQVTYRIKVPAKSIRVLCLFQSQGKSEEELAHRLRRFKAWRGLRDLPREVRKLILNVGRTSGYSGIDLLRSWSSDSIRLVNGDPTRGKVANDTFRIETAFGTVELGAHQVIGMSASAFTDEPLREDKPLPEPDEDAPPDPAVLAGEMRVLLTGGSLLVGRLPEQTLTLKIGEAGTLAIPFSHLREWSYRVSTDKPDDIETLAPHLLLHDGQRVPMPPDQLRLRVETGAAEIDLAGVDIRQVDLGSKPSGQADVTLLNGTEIRGAVRKDAFLVPLRSGAFEPVSVPASLVAKVQLSAQKLPADELTIVTFQAKGHKPLLGRLLDETLAARALDDDANAPLAVHEIKKLTVRPPEQDQADGNAVRVSVDLWSGQSLQRWVLEPRIRLELGSDSVASVRLASIRQIERKQASAPSSVRRRVAELIEQLGSASSDRRNAASNALKKMNKTILPVLREHHRQSTDPEVRARIEDIFEHYGEQITS